MESKKINYAIAKCTLAFMWVYQGIVPKLLGPHKDEIMMNMSLGLTENQAIQLAQIGGTLEVLLGMTILIFWHHRWPLVLTGISMIGLLAFTLIFVPQLTLAAFNPVTVNICVLSLTVIAFNLHSNKSRKHSLNKHDKAEV